MQIKWQVSGDIAESLSDTLSELEASVVSLSNAGSNDIYTVGAEQPIWDLVIVTACFTDDADCEQVQTFIQNQFHIEGKIEKIPDKDWQAEFRQEFQPTQFGQKLWVYPSWVPIPSDLKHVVILDPGLAFGSGSHPTTTMCLEWLDANVKPGMTVIDYGCGTGILGIAAAKLGATKVYAIDNDPQAITAAIENAEKNKVADRVHVMLPDQLVPIKADIVIANILKEPLLTLAETLTPLTTGQMALSGLLQNQAEEVTQAYNTLALTISATKENWVLLSN